MQDIGTSCKMYLLQTGKPFEVGIHKVCSPLSLQNSSSQNSTEITGAAMWSHWATKPGHENPSYHSRIRPCWGSQSTLGQYLSHHSFRCFCSQGFWPSLGLLSSYCGPQMPLISLLTPNHSSSESSPLPTVLAATRLHSNPSIISPVNEEQSS